MPRSMVVDEVLCGAIGYADRVACNENDPLNILIAEEEGDEAADYPSQSLILQQYSLTRGL